MDQMRPALVVKPDLVPDAFPRPAAGFEGLQVNAFLFQSPPEALDIDVIPPPAPPIHRDTDATVLQNLCKIKAHKLAPLI